MGRRGWSEVGCSLAAWCFGLCFRSVLPLKILHVVASLQPASGGPAVSVSRLATEQARLGHDVAIAAFDERHLGTALPTLGVRRVLIPSNFLSAGGRGWSPGLRRTVMAEARDADIVHNHGLWMWPNAYASEAATAAGKPLVISPRGMLEPWSLNRSKLRKAVAWLLFEKRNLRSAAMFHATAESEAESIRDAVRRLREEKTKRQKCEGEKMGGWQEEVPIVVAPNGVDLPDLARRPGREVLEDRFPELKDRRWVVFMSRLHPKKGIDVLLRAWKQQKDVARTEALRDCPKATEWRVTGTQTSECGPQREGAQSLSPILVIAGPDLIGYGSDVERMVRELGEQGSVVITGELLGERKDCLLANAEVFVLPSYSENFGIALAEAMAWGRPVIASTGTPWREVAEVGAGWWVKPEVHELTLALKEALGKDQEQLALMGACGRRLVAANYSWKRSAEKLVAAYAEFVRP